MLLSLKFFGLLARKITLFLSLTFLLPFSSQADPKFNFDDWREEAKQSGFTGNVMVAYKNKIILEEGFGLQDRENDIQFSPDAAFDIMSITKQFTAAGIMKLEEMGRLELTDTLSMYFEDVPNDKKAITLHQLLTHTAGFRSTYKLDYKVVSKADLLNGAFSKSLKFKPGSRYDYSNVGYSLLAIIIEKASGIPYEHFLHQQFFEPLGMTDTGYRIPKWENERLIVGYKDMIPYVGPFLHYALPLVFQKQRWGNSLEQEWAEDGPWWNLRGNGGMISTMQDMFTWHKALQTEQVLTRASIDKMYTPYALKSKK
jgi:CubicO group peptidase (beta-lactamase class C family)